MNTPNHRVNRLWLAAGLLWLGCTAQAEPMPESNEGCAPAVMPALPEPRMLPPSFMHGLDLTEKQQDTMFRLAHEQAPKVRQMAKNAQHAMQALQRMAASGSYDAARARKLADDIGKAIAEMALSHSQAEAQMLALLTPEQRRQLDNKRPPF